MNLRRADPDPSPPGDDRPAAGTATPDAPGRSRLYRARDALQVGGTVGIGTVLVMIYGLQGKIADVSATLATMQAQQTLMAQTVERVQARQTETEVRLSGQTQAANSRLDLCDLRYNACRDDIAGLGREVRDHGVRLGRLEEHRAAVLGMRAPDTQGRIAQLVDAIRSIDPKEQTAWTKDTPPLPTVRALAKATGTPVSRGERDAAVAAWALLQSQPPGADPGAALER